MAPQSAVRRAAFGVLLTACLFVALAFLLIPILAIFLESPLRDLPDLLSQQVVRDAIVITLETNVVANLLILGFGTPAAYFLATRRFRGRNVVLTLVELPLVLPPAVAGVGLLAAFGTIGLIGDNLEAHGVVLPVHRGGRRARDRVRGVARSTCARPSRRSRASTRTSSPRRARSAPGRAARSCASRCRSRSAACWRGWALAFARGIGEFGATLIFAGNIQAVTQTLPLAIYEQLEVDFDVALAMGCLLVVLSAAILLSTKMLTSWMPSRSRSRSSFGTSASTPS